MSGNLKLQTKSLSSFNLSECVTQILTHIPIEFLGKYLGDDLEKLRGALPLLAEELVKKISGKCFADKSALLEVMSHLKDTSEGSQESNVLDYAIYSRDNDRLADQGTSILTNVFGVNLGEVVSDISVKSTLRDESDFTLLAILTAKFTSILKGKFLESAPETFEVLNVFRDLLELPGTDADKVKVAPIVSTKPLVLVGGDSVPPAIEKRNVFRIIFPWIITLILLSLVPLLNSKKFSAIKFVEYTKDVGSKITIDEGLSKVSSKFSRVKEWFRSFASQPQKAFPSVILGDADISDSESVLSNEKEIKLYMKKDEGSGPPEFKIVFDKRGELETLKVKYAANTLERHIVDFLLNEENREGKFILEGIDFLFNRIEIDSEGRKKLTSIADILAKVDLDHLDVVGHTDNIGPDPANQRVSLERAMAAREVLVKAGIDASKIIARGAGSLEPLAANDDNASRHKNRRLELILKKKAKI